MSHMCMIYLHMIRTYVLHSSHTLMSHVTHMNESCHTYQWVMSHISTSHVTHMNEYHTYVWVMTKTECVGKWVCYILIFPHTHFPTHSLKFWIFFLACQSPCIACVYSLDTWNAGKMTSKNKEFKKINFNFICLRRQGKTWPHTICLNLSFVPLIYRKWL